MQLSHVGQSISLRRFHDVILTVSSFRDAKAAVVCYAVDDRGSWERLKHWVEELKSHEEGCRVYLCATKKDLLTGGNIKRAVHYTTTTDYCEEIGAKLYETSSKNGSNVSKLFEEIARDYLTMNRHEEPAADGEKLTLVELGSQIFARASYTVRYILSITLS